MLSQQSYLKIVRASAWYDIAVTFAFATPWTFAVLIGTLTQIHQGLGLSGQVPVAGVYETLFANFFGTVVLLWSFVRLRQPTVFLGRMDGIGRLLFSTWQVNALLSGASSLIAVFLVIELTLGVVQWWPVAKVPSGT